MKEFTCSNCGHEFEVEDDRQPYTDDGDVICNDCLGVCDICEEFVDYYRLTYIDDKHDDWACPECLAKLEAK